MPSEADLNNISNRNFCEISVECTYSRVSGKENVTASREITLIMKYNIASFLGPR